MKTTEFNTQITSEQLNENMFKKFGKRVNFEKYTREELENYRNILRTKVHQLEGSSQFNELLANENYQQDKFMLDLLNTRIKEMLGESKKKLSEKAVSKAQQQAAGIALAAKKSGKKPAGKGASAEMAKMPTKELKKFAGTKRKGLPKHVDEASDSRKEHEYNMDVAQREIDRRDAEGEDMTGAKIDPKTYKIIKPKKVSEASKPDFLDIDKDGNKKEPMKKAAKDAKKNKPAVAKKDAGKKGMSPKQAKFFGKKTAKVKESSIKQSYKMIIEGLNHFLAEDEEGKAKDITAGTDMVNDFTSWMQRIGQYQTKSTIELADSIRANFGQADADTFKNAITPALQEALSALTQSRETIARAVAVLAGEESAQEPMGSTSDSMNVPPQEDEFGASDAAAGGSETAGRETRESRMYKRALKLAESHSIMNKLAK